MENYKIEDKITAIENIKIEIAIWIPNKSKIRGILALIWWNNSESKDLREGLRREWGKFLCWTRLGWQDDCLVIGDHNIMDFKYLLWNSSNKHMVNLSNVNAICYKYTLWAMITQFSYLSESTCNSTEKNDDDCMKNKGCCYENMIVFCCVVMLFVMKN